MKLHSENGLGSAAFLFLFVMAGLCIVAGLIKMFSVTIAGVLVCGFIALIVLMFKKQQS